MFVVTKKEQTFSKLGSETYTLSTYGYLDEADMTSGGKLVNSRCRD